MRLLTILLVMMSASVALARQSEQRDARPPNIVFVLADDLGWGELGSYGQDKIRTPRLDELARQGMRFTQHYSGSPVCAPCRAILMTGKHGGKAYIRDNMEVQPEGQWPIPESDVTIAELLKQRGYATAAIGKWGLGMLESEGSPLVQGFDGFFGYYCQRHAHNHYPTYLWRNAERIELEGNDGGLQGEQYSHDLFMREAQGFIRQHKDEHFFLFLPLIIPHLSIQVPDEALAQYAEMEEAPFEQRDGYHKHPTPRAGYAAMISHMDRTLGDLFDLLDELGLADNTIVIFTSDNGPTGGRTGGADSAFFESNGPFRGFKGSVYEGGIRVPLIVRWPGRVEAGSTSDLPTVFYDWMPTLLELAGAPDAAPEAADGISFAATLLGRPQAQKDHDFMYWEFAGYGGQQAVRMGNWKGVRRDLHKGNTTWELYDLATDPAEANDLAAQHSDIVRQLATIARREHTVSELFPIKVLDNAQEAAEPTLIHVNELPPAANVPVTGPRGGRLQLAEVPLEDVIELLRQQDLPDGIVVDRPALEANGLLNKPLTLDATRLGEALDQIRSQTGGKVAYAWHAGLKILVLTAAPADAAATARRIVERLHVAQLRCEMAQQRGLAHGAALGKAIGLPLDFSSVPLEDVVAFLSNVSAVPIRFDDGVNAGQREVTLAVPNAGQSLGLVLQQALDVCAPEGAGRSELTWVVRGGELVITRARPIRIPLELDGASLQTAVELVINATNVSVGWDEVAFLKAGVGIMEVRSGTLRLTLAADVPVDQALSLLAREAHPRAMAIMKPDGGFLITARPQGL